MKSMYLILPACLICQPLMAYEEEPYDETPLAVQIADLKDDDLDGVINARDDCPSTPRGALVDNDGCGEKVREQEVKQLRILFANDSYEINPVFSDQIRQMALFLETYESASIEVQGYASKVGSAEHNLALSKERAHAVEDRLIANGVEPERVRIVGYGDTRPESAGDDATSHALNRRVTATVVGLNEEIVEEWTIFTTLEK